MPPSRVIVGEVRAEECLDLLLALNAGLPALTGLDEGGLGDAEIMQRAFGTAMVTCAVLLALGGVVSALFIRSAPVAAESQPPVSCPPITAASTDRRSPSPPGQPPTGAAPGGSRRSSWGSRGKLAPRNGTVRAVPPSGLTLRRAERRTRRPGSSVTASRTFVAQGSGDLIYGRAAVTGPPAAQPRTTPTMPSGSSVSGYL